MELSPSYPSELEATLQFLEQHIDTTNLIAHIKTHQIPLVRDLTLPVAVLWDARERAIRVNPDQFTPLPVKGEVHPAALAHILFALHNASCEELSNLMTTPSNDVEHRIEKMERLQHASALETSRILEQLIASKQLPPDIPFRNIFADFRFYYLLEQIEGHAKLLAERFLGSTCYKGNWQEEIPAMEKKYLRRYLLLKLRWEKGAPKAKEQLQRFFLILGKGVEENSTLHKRVVSYIFSMEAPKT